MPREPAPTPPESIGDRYEILRELGTGGFGTTYAALDRDTGREVAVKVLDLSRVGEWKSVELFEREAQVLRTLDHPGIPAYVDFRPLEDTRQAYLVQSLAPGESLARLLARRRFTEPQLLDLAERVLEILRYLTTLHPIVVHRDVKPANILLAEDGTVSLVDFGAVRAVASATIGGGSTVAGTFGYMAPEQLQGIALPSSDLYGLGMTLVHLATGRDPSDLPTKRLKPDFQPHVELSPALERFVDRLIEPVPDDRYPSAAAALEALREVRAAAAEVPSSSDIARLRARAEQAERERRAKASPRASEVRARPAAPDDRVRFTEDDEGATLEIRPERRWRGREAHLGLFTIPAMFLVLFPAMTWGAAGFLGGLASAALATWLVWWSAPTWRLRLTRDGDFAYYPRSPRRPSWVGRARELRIETVPTAGAGTLVHLVHRDRSATHYPLTSRDVAEFRRAAAWLDARAGGGASALHEVH